MHALKLALNKSMHASDNEQGINQLRPNKIWYVKIKFGLVRKVVILLLFAIYDCVIPSLILVMQQHQLKLNSYIIQRDKFDKNKRINK